MVGIDDADRCLLHGDIEADVVLLVHGGAPRLDRSAIMPPLPPRRAPRIPHLAPTGMPPALGEEEWRSASRKLKAADVIDVMSDLFILRGVPGHVRSDNVLRSEEGRLAGQQVSVREHALAA